MRTKIALLLSFAIICNACNKDKYTDRPQLSFKSLPSSTTLDVPDAFTFVLGFTDKQGDIDSIFIQRVSKVCPDSPVGAFKLKESTYQYPIPYFPATKNQAGDINLPFVYSSTSKDSTRIVVDACINASGRAGKTDTSSFRFCLKDKAGHLSDTLKSPYYTFLLN
ncbi:hypothetical protein [Parasediminibacterium sp. JCM 36343]|uniref:hypothetical protein n=1 Tax=Parasediminibacterium sp. JCM 36343 TaxID=3374279 RepID=UPI00397A22AD